MHARFVLSILLTAALPAAAQTCDRACLKSIVTQYLDALVKHDPSKLPVTPNVRFTEDGDEKKLGEGVWKTIGSLGAFRQDVLDVRESTAGVHVLAMEDGKPILFAARIKVTGGKISEV